MGRRGFLARLLGAALPLGGSAAAKNAIYVPPDKEAFDRRRFPFPIVTSSGEAALKTWRTLVERDHRSTPVIIGTNFSVNRLLEPLQFSSRGPAEILTAAAGLSFPADLARTRDKEKARAEAALAAHPEFRSRAQFKVLERGQLRDETPEERTAREARENTGPAVGDWPTVVEPYTWGAVARAFGSRSWAPEVHIAILPTADPCEVPAYLRYGGWNECPAPEFHVAALRSWRDRYGARIVSCGFDTVELQVSRRPGSREEALALAREQYLYCNDLIDQGLGAFSALAAGLMASDWWYFWWD